MALSEIVDVRIDREIPTVSREGFGTPLFLTESTGDSDLSAGDVRSYGSVKELEEDFSSSDAAYKAGEAAFAQDSGLSRFKIAIKDEAEDWADAIGNVIDTDDDWYCLLADTRDSSNIEEIANNIESRKKIYLAVTSDSEVLDGDDDTDIASTLLDEELSRTGLMYHSEASDEYPEAAWAGLLLPEDPGSVTWAFKSLSGIPTDSFKSSERRALRDKRCNHYISVAGNSITYEGYTSEPGVYIDVVRGLDWLEQRMAEDIFATLASVPKIPYVGGAEILEQRMRQRLDIAVDRDVITEDYEVEVPTADEQQDTDRADRVYKDVTFEAQLAGAVHKIEIRGTVTV